MSDLKKVLESLDLPQELKDSITEAWNDEVQQNRKEVREAVEKEIKEQQSSDIDSLVEAADALVTATLQAELREFHEERTQLREQLEQERAKAVRQRVLESKENQKTLELLQTLVSDVVSSEVKELHEDRKHNQDAESKLLEQFKEVIDQTILAEMKEFGEDRKALNESVGKMESLVVNQLTRELSEFQEDRRDLKEKSARLEKEYHRKLEESKQAFMDRASKSISEMVDKTLQRELTVLKEDIRVAKENNFGRRIFETFAAEYLTSHLSEGTEIFKLRKEISESQKNMQKMQEMIKERELKLNKSNAALRESREKMQRSEKLSELLRPLSGTQRETMKQLLENVGTERLEESFNRYIPAILEDGGASKPKRKMVETGRGEKKKQLSESTGDRDTRGSETSVGNQRDTDEVERKEIETILRQAGITNINRNPTK